VVSSNLKVQSLKFIGQRSKIKFLTFKYKSIKLFKNLGEWSNGYYSPSLPLSWLVKSRDSNKHRHKTQRIDMKPGIVIGLGVLGIVIMIGTMMAGMPRYTVWQQEMSGKAEFAKAEQNRKIKIEEAKALDESAQFQAKAEITRAKGVAEANKIIGDSLKGNESYLRYLWVNQLSDNSQNVIYIPTEAGMPILEAGKR